MARRTLTALSGESYWGMCPSVRTRSASATLSAPRKHARIGFPVPLWLAFTRNSAVSFVSVIACGVSKTSTASTFSSSKTVLSAKWYASARASPRTSTGFMQFAAAGRWFLSFSIVSSVKAANVNPARFDRVGRHDPRAAGIGDHGDRSSLGQRLIAECPGHIKLRLNRIATDDTGADKRALVDRVPSGKASRMGGSGTPTGAGSTGFHQEDGFCPSRFAPPFERRRPPSSMLSR